MSIRLTALSRAALRKAIGDHSEWNTVRRARNLSFASMTRDDYISVAKELGLDYQAIIISADGELKSGNRIKARMSFGEAFTARDDSEEASAVIAETARALGVARATEAKAATVEKLATPNADDEDGDAAGWGDEANSIGNKIAQALGAAIASMSAQMLNPEQIRKMVKAEVTTAMAGNSVLTIDVKRGDELVGRVEGAHHPEFPKLLRAASARAADGYAPNVWIAGPAGSGKTHAVRMVAKALSDDFHFNGAIGMQHELLGFKDAGGVTHRTPFRDAYEHGGCYLFDEVDGSDNSALLALNAALANGRATFPDKAVTRHAECRIFASANTWGFGGTADYVGRSKIDAAFLSRFPVRLMFDYDAKLERSICGNPEFAARVQEARAKARNAGLKVLITPRDSIAGAALIAAGFTEDEAAQMTYLAALNEEQRRMIS